MKQIYLRDGYEPFYQDVISKVFKAQSNNGEYSQRQVIEQIKVLNEKVEQARDLFMTGEFNSVDFQTVKTKCEKEINSLEKKLPDIIQTTRIVDQILTVSISNLKKLIYSYKCDKIDVKRKIISSTYPQNMVFDGFQHRTKRRNEIVDCILQINKELGVKKNWTSVDLQHLSSKVGATGFEPVTLCL